MAASMVFKLACVVVVACMVMCGPNVEAAISCVTVVSKVTPCIRYLMGPGGDVPAACCAGVKSLNALASTTPDRKTACTCLKQAGSSIPGIKIPLVEGLPGKCGVSIPYKINPSTDCSKVV